MLTPTLLVDAICFFQHAHTHRHTHAGTNCEVIYIFITALCLCSTNWYCVCVVCVWLTGCWCRVMLQVCWFSEDSVGGWWFMALSSWCVWIVCCFHVLSEPSSYISSAWWRIIIILSLGTAEVTYCNTGYPPPLPATLYTYTQTPMQTWGIFPYTCISTKVRAQPHRSYERWILHLSCFLHMTMREQHVYMQLWEWSNFYSVFSFQLLHYKKILHY